MMAAYSRNVRYLLSSERNTLLTRGTTAVIEFRRYVRGLRRKPVRVIFPEAPAGKIAQPPQKDGSAPKRSEKRAESAPEPRPTRRGEDEDGRDALSQQTTREQTDKPRFETAAPGDKRLSRLVSIARSRTFREQQGKILLEGRRLICDALEAGANPQMVFFSRMERLCELPLDKLRRATLVKVKFQDIKLWSDVVAPQGVIGIFSRPDPSRLRFTHAAESMPLSLVCDNIRDPGNLGTILRCAAAAGCQDVLLSKGCVDVWEPKVLRAAMGAHFCLPIYTSLDWEDIQARLAKPATVHVADSSCRQSKALDSDSDSDSDSDLDSDSDSDSDSEDEGVSPPQVDTRLYHDSWAHGATALVIGGETHGLSVEALRLAEKTAGRRLLIPMVPRVDSLNSAMAASILLFEGRRQLLKVTESFRRKVRGQDEHQRS